MALPKFLQSYLASYDLKSLEVKRDKKLIITQVLNRGDDQALCWLSKYYSPQDIKQVVSSPTRGMWAESVLDYWLKIFGIKLENKTACNIILERHTYSLRLILNYMCGYFVKKFVVMQAYGIQFGFRFLSNFDTLFPSNLPV